MKDPLDNQAVDWCEGSMPKSNIQIFERFAALIKAIRETPIATTKEVQKLALPDMSPRSCQRYVKQLVDAGYVRKVGSKDMGYRLYPTEKAKMIFGGAK
ncbi:winged helix-turn-helix domain-containing protein [Acinetobacter sp.]|uniref:winged helix-turn-helix domain-containing protein n=1 Tax=Acinetobacter sp. TaxID=472 RepID=UPI0028A58ADB|nr:winged helix-turn-helix domain-containing protein [Acinetobacter sp.]